MASLRSWSSSSPAGPRLCFRRCKSRFILLFLCVFLQSACCFRVFRNLRWIWESTLAIWIYAGWRHFLGSQARIRRAYSRQPKGPPPTSRVHHCAHVFTRFTCKYTAWCPVWYFACPYIWSLDQPHRHVASWTYNRYPIADRWHKSHRVMPPTFHHHHNHTVNIQISKPQTNYDLNNNQWIEKMLPSSSCKRPTYNLSDSSPKRI